MCSCKCWPIFASNIYIQIYFLSMNSKFNKETVVPQTQKLQKKNILKYKLGPCNDFCFQLQDTFPFSQQKKVQEEIQINSKPISTSNSNTFFGKKVTVQIKQRGQENLSRMAKQSQNIIEIIKLDPSQSNRDKKSMGEKRKISILQHKVKTETNIAQNKEERLESNKQKQALVENSVQIKQIKEEISGKYKRSFESAFQSYDKDIERMPQKIKKIEMIEQNAGKRDCITPKFSKVNIFEAQKIFNLESSMRAQQESNFDVRSESRELLNSRQYPKVKRQQIKSRFQPPSALNKVDEENLQLWNRLMSAYKKQFSFEAELRTKHINEAKHESEIFVPNQNNQLNENQQPQQQEQLDSPYRSEVGINLDRVNRISFPVINNPSLQRPDFENVFNEDRNHNSFGEDNDIDLYFIEASDF